jgi:Flp pilus assembly protein TadG
LDDLLRIHPDPHLALSIEPGRDFYAWAEVAEAADAAALVAATEIIIRRVFEETEDLQPTSKTWANAQV